MAIYDEHKFTRGVRAGQWKPAGARTGKRWRVSYFDPIVGKTRERYFDKLEGTGGAKAFDARKKSENERGVFVDEKAGQVLFRSYWTSWLENQSIKASTREAYERIFRKHFKPHFGHMKMTAIVRTHVQGFVSKIEKNYAGSTVNTWYNILSGVFKAAVLDKVIGTTPCVKISLPPKKKNDKKWIPRPVQVAAFIRAFDPRFQLAVILAASCGLRFSEIMGLTVDDIDFKNMKVRVHRQLARDGKEWVLTTPKTRTSTRDVDMPAHVVAAARKHIESGVPRPYTMLDFTAGKKANADTPRVTVDLLFNTKANSLPIWRTEWTDAWRAGIKAAGKVLKDAPADFTTHTLRHYFVSLLIAAGADVVEVQHAVGHADPTTTYNTYTHLWPERRDRQSYIQDAFTKAEAELNAMATVASLPIAA